MFQWNELKEYDERKKTLVNNLQEMVIDHHTSSIAY